MAEPMPDWLRTQLEVAGRLDTDGVARKARSGRCRDCGAEILTGLDSDRCALTATVDPWPVDAYGELSALLTGRATYSLFGLELVWRDASAVRTRPCPVLVEHRCGNAIPHSPLADISPRLAAISSDIPPY